MKIKQSFLLKMSSLKQHIDYITADVEDEMVKAELISSLTFFGSKINEDNRESLRQKLLEKLDIQQPPRKLTEDEIDEIVEFSTPQVAAVIEEVSRDNNRQIKNFLKSELRRKKMVVTPENINILKKRIKEMYYRSLVAAGDSVGVEVAMSFGQPLTQMNLDTFHSAGASSELGSGVKSLQELFNTSSNRKKNMTTIHFRRKNMTREEVIRKGKLLKGISIRDLLTEDPVVIEVSEDDDIWWYNNSITLFPPKTELGFEYGHCLRLKFNVNKCYNHDISTQDIMNALDDKTLITVASPSNIGIVDIYPNPDYLSLSIIDLETVNNITLKGCKRKSRKLNDITSDDNQNKILFLTAIVEKCLDDICIKGIKGIKSIVPITQNIVTNIKTSRVSGRSGQWYIHLNRLKMKYNEVPYQNIMSLCELIGFEILDNNATRSLNPYLIVLSDEDPIDIMTQEVDAARELVKQSVKLKTQSEDDHDLPDYPPIYRAAYYNYAMAEGEKIVTKLMRHPELDNKFILPSNPNEIFAIFGIESARLYMVREYVKLIEDSNSYVTPVNIELLVDYQTNMGFLTAIHANGSSKQGTSALSAAAFMDPVGAFQKAAAIGKTDSINSISACIMAGKQALNGTGLSRVKLESTTTKPPPRRKETKSMAQEFCESKYTFGDTEEVTIDIERAKKPRPTKPKKFSTIPHPSEITPMQPPAFLAPKKPVRPKKSKPPESPISVGTQQFTIPDDFMCPDKPSVVPDLKDF
jgi:hypothetical protein